MKKSKVITISEKDLKKLIQKEIKKALDNFDIGKAKISYTISRDSVLNRHRSGFLDSSPEVAYERIKSLFNK